MDEDIKRNDGENCCLYDFLVYEDSCIKISENRLKLCVLHVQLTLLSIFQSIKPEVLVNKKEKKQFEFTSFSEIYVKAKCQYE